MVYLDNSATTRPRDEVTARMAQINSEIFANPSSLHRLGLAAEKVMRSARETLLAAIGAGDGTVIFTSGGTEANNLALFGAAGAAARRGRRVVTTKLEHPSVSNPIQELGRMGAQVAEVGADRFGFIRLEELEAALTQDTALVSIMLVNNEVGSVQPVGQAARLIKDRCPDALLHVDAVQGFGKIPVSAAELGADLLTVSGHKLHGPKGVGALWVRRGVHIKPTLFGGGQEGGLRSGTENTAAVGGLETAVSLAMAQQKEAEPRMGRLRSLLSELLAESGRFCVNGGDPSLLPAGSRAAYAPHILNISAMGVPGEVLLHAAEARDVFVSTGSACSSNHPAPSPTLTAMGLSRDRIRSAIRISLSAQTSEEDIRYAAKVLAEEAEKLCTAF